MQDKVLIFDLDGTLYPNDGGYVDHIRENARKYIARKLSINEEDAEELRKKALATSNQTAKGLKTLGYDWDFEEFVDAMREDEDKFLKPDPRVRECLEALPQKKWILTNTREKHAKKALTCLGLNGLWEEVLGADFMDPACKPEEAAFVKVLDHIGAKAEDCVLFEDSLRNTRQAKSMGMMTVFIEGTDPEQGEGEGGGPAAEVSDGIISHVVTSQLKAALPSLFELEQV